MIIAGWLWWDVSSRSLLILQWINMGYSFQHLWKRRMPRSSSVDCCIRFGELNSARSNDCKWRRFEVCCLSIFHLDIRAGNVWAATWLYDFYYPRMLYRIKDHETLCGVWRVEGLKPAKSAPRWNGRHGAPPLTSNCQKAFLGCQIMWDNLRGVKPKDRGGGGSVDPSGIKRFSLRPWYCEQNNSIAIPAV